MRYVVVGLTWAELDAVPGHISHADEVLCAWGRAGWEVIDVAVRAEYGLYFTLGFLIDDDDDDEALAEPEDPAGREAVKDVVELLQQNSVKGEVIQ